jgi:hypothetical protein
MPLAPATFESVAKTVSSLMGFFFISTTFMIATL